MAAPGDADVRVIHKDDLKTLLAEAAEMGAANFARSIGLEKKGEADDVAADIREMRTWLAAWRTARQTAWKTVVRVVTHAFLVLLLLGLAWKMGVKLPTTN